ncbi:MAG TPA: gas vesicle protein GvpO [Thermosynergistes sp.]|nr:gas vesicle protein GvpO [Thermosynergistes sp.]
MNAEEVIKRASEEIAKLAKIQVERVVGLSKADQGWMVSLEGVERRAIPETMDVLGLYEVLLDEDGNLLSFGRKSLRKRGDTEER